MMNNMKLESHTPLVAVVVVNWNGKDDTLDCLQSLDKVEYGALKIILVDNGSTDGSVGIIKECHPHIDLIETHDNLGFVGGNNVGMKAALAEGADYILLLNNDTIVAPDFLSHLVKYLDDHPSTGIVGPLIYYHSSPEILWSAGGKVDPTSGDTRMLGMGESQVDLGTISGEMDFVTGCALMIRADVIRQVGMLDERFFAYYEETEWCARVRKAGYEIHIIPEAKIWHKISPEAREASAQVNYYMTRNRLLFIKLTGLGMGAGLKTLIMNYMRTLISWTIKPKWRSKTSQRKALIRGVRDYFLGRFGRVDLAS